MTMETTTKTLYTLLVYSENLAGILNQITAVFTRRQVNIESLNVSASSIEGVHKYTITAWSDEDQIIKITKQIEKKIDVIKADYYTTFCCVMLSGMTEEITGLYYALAKFNCMLQYTRSGRIAITRSTVEEVSDFLEKQEQNRNNDA